MDIARVIREHCERAGIGEVPICGIEDAPIILRGVDGRSYREVEGNVWMPLGGDGDVAYVGTSRHGGHMTLRPLFVRVEGVWRNAVTGREVEFAHWGGTA
jgi:hypothetical protein